MSLKTFESLKLKLTDDRCPFVVTATGTSIEPIGFTLLTLMAIHAKIHCLQQPNATHHFRKRLRITKLYWCHMDKTRLQENDR